MGRIEQIRGERLAQIRARAFVLRAEGWSLRDHEFTEVGQRWRHIQMTLPGSPIHGESFGAQRPLESIAPVQAWCDALLTLHASDLPWLLTEIEGLEEHADSWRMLSEANYAALMAEKADKDAARADIERLRTGLYEARECLVNHGWADAVVELMDAALAGREGK